MSGNKGETVRGHHSEALNLSARPRRRSHAWQRVLAAACAALLLVPAAPLRAQHNLPSLGDSAGEDFGVGTERRVGDQIMREIRRDPDYLDDPLLLEYLQSLWAPLVAEGRTLGNIGADIDGRYAWEAFLVRDRSVNAFALPGGYVGVHLGLIAMTASRDELASVLAHELTHVTQRHIARSITNSKRQSLIGLAALIVGVLAASRAGSSDAANAAITGSQAAAIQGQLNFSRDMEREADRLGFAVMTGAGFSPGGMAAMFEKLDQASRLNDSGNFPYLRSHPLTSERVGEARSRLGAGETPRPAMGAPAPSALEHTLAQARARVLMDTRVDALRRWQGLDAERGGAAPSPAERVGALATSALASTLLREHARADRALERAVEIVRSRNDARAMRALMLLTAQAMLARGDAARAALALQPYLNEGTRPVALLAAQVALAAAPAQARDDPALRRSADELQTRVATRPNDALVWTTLGQVWGRLDQPLRALRADAEAQLALGDLPGAMDRLRAGQRLARSGAGVDFIEASVIDSRLRDVQAQWRELTAEERGNRP
jgi:predicted Zn-dependent protease